LNDDRLDLDPGTREVLEFDAVLAWLAEHARTVPGRACLVATVPWTDPRPIRETSEIVREALDHLDGDGAIVPAGLPDPGPALAALGVEDVRLDAPSLRDLARFAVQIAEIGEHLRGLAVDRWPRLRGTAVPIPDLRRWALPILHAIEPDGTLRDAASDELREVRAARRRGTERLQRQLLALARDPGSGVVVRDDFVTQRNGRFVIPVRTDTPRPVRGIVHASSSSGATQFVEPLDAVEANNEIARLAEREAREIDRLLGSWSRELGRHREELERGAEILGWLDSIQARALYARDVDGVLAAVGPNEPIKLREARHPLLARRLRERGGRCVPLDLGLDPPGRVLVLSGPNAGGKTVALKMLGLASLLAQSAIPLPARSVRLPIYRQVRADVGDRQSIAADLSTFTAHVRAVTGYLHGATPPCLFLFDEIGTGTEPREGAALSLAILDELRRPGCTVVATTHQSEIKTWALTTHGAASAALEFDPVEMRPTFRVLPGAAGVSAGLDIALRVGLDSRIVERARALLGESARQSEELLARLRERAAELERRAGELESQRVAAVEAHARLERELAEEVERSRRDARSALDRALGVFEAESRRALTTIESQSASRTATRSTLRVTARVRERHAELRDELAPETPVGRRPAGEVVEGQTVYVRSLGREGRVAGVRGERVDVLLGRVSFRVERSDLWTSEPGGDAAVRGGSSPAIGTTVRAETDEPPSEVQLLGQTVEQALEVVDKFLDRAALAGLAEVRIVHGHGTGRLRRAIRAFLDRHVHVNRHRPGGDREGGDGATVVTLR